MSQKIEADWFFQMWADAMDGSDIFPAHSVYQPITSPIHQVGKTSFALREAEIVLEVLKGRKFDPANISFDVSHFMERRNAIGKYEIQILDEPQRAASSRTWHNEDQNILAEDLMASNRFIKPALFPTPLNAMIDNRIFDISTSQAVITRKAHAEIYYLDRPQLDRSNRRPRTPKIGSLVFSRPSEELRLAYEQAFQEDYDRRNQRARERVKAIQSELGKVVSPLQADDIVPLILAEHEKDPSKLIGNKGHISPKKVMIKWNIPFNRAQEAAAKATDKLEHDSALEQAETGK